MKRLGLAALPILIAGCFSFPRSPEEARRALSSDKAFDRYVAIGFLSDTHDKKYAADIEPLLKDWNPSVRAGAVGGLTKLVGKEALPAIDQALTDSNDMVRVTALQMRLGVDKDGSDDAVERAAGDPSWLVRAQAAESFDTDMPPVGQFLTDRHEVVRSIAMRKAARLKLAGYQEAAQAMLKNSSPMLRASGLEYVKRLEVHSLASDVVGLLNDETQAEHPSSLLLQEYGQRQTFGLVFSLMASGFGKGGEKETIRIKALETLKVLKVRETAKAVAPLLDHRDGKTRWLAFDILCSLGPEFAKSALDKFLRHPDSSTRAAAIRHMMWDGPVPTSAELIPFLRDPSSDVRFWTLIALEDIDARDACEVIAPLVDDAETLVRREAISALMKLEGRAHVDRIAQHFDDSDTRVRYAALEAVGKLQGRRYEGRLEAALKDPAWEARASAMWGLAALLGKESVPRIKPLLDDPEVAVGAACALMSVDPENHLRRAAEFLSSKNPETACEVAIRLSAATAPKLYAKLMNARLNRFTKSEVERALGCRVEVQAPEFRWREFSKASGFRLERELGMFWGRGEATLILDDEKNLLRVVGLDEARAYWKERLK